MGQNSIHPTSILKHINHQSNQSQSHIHPSCHSQPPISARSSWPSSFHLLVFSLNVDAVLISGSTSFLPSWVTSLVSFTPSTSFSSIDRLDALSTVDSFDPKTCKTKAQ